LTTRILLADLPEDQVAALQLRQVAPFVVTRGEGFLGIAVALVILLYDTAESVIGGEAGIRAVSQCLAGEARTPKGVVGVSTTVVFDLGIAVNRKA
jgi:hypothetical protein